MPSNARTPGGEAARSRITRLLTEREASGPEKVDTVTQSSVYGGYRPTSAKDYNRYNYYSTVTTEPDSSYLSGTAAGSSSSPRWRRRSYDHDSDYLRYQRRTSGRSSASTLADYPPAQPSGTSATSSASALTR